MFCRLSTTSRRTVTLSPTMCLTLRIPILKTSATATWTPASVRPRGCPIPVPALMVILSSLCLLFYTITPRVWCNWMCQRANGYGQDTLLEDKSQTSIEELDVKATETLFLLSSPFWYIQSLLYLLWKYFFCRFYTAKAWTQVASYKWILSFSKNLKKN